MDPFKKAEEEYLRLRERLIAGRMTRDEFYDAQKTLLVRDVQNRLWMIHPDSGQWLVYQDKQWITTPRPTLNDARSTRSTKKRRPRPAPTLPPRFLVTAGLAGLVIILLIVGYIMNPSPERGANSVSSLETPAPSTPALGSLRTEPTLISSPVAQGIPAVIVSSKGSRLQTPAEFAAAAGQLAATITDLNRAELVFLVDAKQMLALDPPRRIAGSAAPWLEDQKDGRLNQGLREIAARGVRVARLADDMARTVASQENGSQEAGQLAEPYLAVARMGFALVIEAQNLRDELMEGTLKRNEAVDRIAEYGARLWNPRVVSNDANEQPSLQTKNPFFEFVSNHTDISDIRLLGGNTVKAWRAGLGSKTPRLWLATGPVKTLRTLNVPAPSKPVNLVFDPGTPELLSSAQGEADGDRARQFAAAQLDRARKGPSNQLQVNLVTVAFADADLIEDAIVPSFIGGKGALVTTAKNSNGVDDVYTGLHALVGTDVPRVEVTKPVLTGQPSMEITIGDVVLEQVNANGDSAEVTYRYNIEWRSRQNIQAHATLSCSSAHSFIQSAELDVLNGTDIWRMDQVKIDYPGEITIRCQIWRTDTDDVRWFSETATTFRVGDNEVAMGTAQPPVIATTAPSTGAKSTSTATSVPTAIPTNTAATKAILSTPTRVEQSSPATPTSPASPSRTSSASSSGVYNLDWKDSAAGLLLPTSGYLKLAVDWTNGSAAADLEGGGEGQARNVCVLSIPWTYRVRYTARFNGTLNPLTGALNLSGKTSGTNNTSPATCSCDQKKCEGGVRTNPFDIGPIMLDGFVERVTGNGKGRLYVPGCKGTEYCQGEWRLAP